MQFWCNSGTDRCVFRRHGWRMDLARHRRRLLAGLVVVLAVLVVGQRLGVGVGAGSSGASTRPARAPVPATTPASASSATPIGELVVDVVGAVRRGGLYRLPAGSRVADAVRMAGGVTRRAQLELVNLAAPLADGEQVLIPRAGAAGAAAAPGATVPAAPIQLSVATPEQLDTLPGIGPAMAARIVQYRQEHGTFHSVDDLAGVPGIGPAKLAALKGLVVP
jgi:competence protein ComEA